MAYTACLLVLISSLAVAQTPAAPDMPAQPNVVLILCDDLGIATLGCYGNRFIDTPSVDRMAVEGVRFTAAYTAAPVCSPTRAALMTGQWPVRSGINDYLRPDAAEHLDPSRPSLPRLFRDAGYRTAIVGKWHLTGYAANGAQEVGPARLGFDEVIVSESTGIGGGSYFHPYKFNPAVPRRLPAPEYLTDRLNSEAVEFIRRNAARPFFLYLSHYAPHTKLDAKPRLKQKYQERAKTFAGRPNEKNPVLAAMLESIDEGVGTIRKTLDELGLTRKTLVIFTSDNGGELSVSSNEPCRGGKSMLYEGGLRVPLVAVWPGVIPAGGRASLPVTTPDFLPTLAAILGARAPSGQPRDGIDLTPVLRDPSSVPKRPPLFWHYPLAKPHFLGGESAGAVRSGDWKLIEFFHRGEVELYNLAADPGEKQNLAAANSAKRAELLKLLRDWRASVGADRKVDNVDATGRPRS